MAEQTATAATFLFTDIEGSTQLLKRLRDRYGAVLAQHQQLLREAFAAHGGQEVDTQGDAFFVAFPRARNAVLAAVEAQRALAAHEWPDGEELLVRIGVHTGEAAVAENRYVGLSVHRAARICALGRGGQILVSRTTRHVLEDDEEPLPGIELRDLGEHELKDLARPVRLSEVIFEEAPPASQPEPDHAVVRDQRTVLPGALALASAFPFVGRSAELESLGAMLPLGVDDGRRLALLGGEPGSGKTRLIRELAHEAAAGGVLVLYGTSDAVVNPPYKPFVEALEFLVRVLEPDLVRRALGTGGGELTRLLPDLSARLGPFPAPVSADPDTERHRLHTAVSELLFEVGRRQPVLLVLDDVHWADPPTLHLLRHLARAGDVRILLLASFRDREPEASPELSDSLADLSRVEGVTRVRLTGLESADVEDFVRRSAGAAGAVELRRVALSLEEVTEGNPFLLCELWRSLVESGAIEVAETGVRLARPVAELTSPESVRDVVRYRLSRLAPSTKALLEIAAIVGAEFELAVLREAAGLEDDELYGALDEAVRTGTIEEVPGPGLSHRFTHELVRRALADGLTSLRRAELHLAVAEALERVHAALPARVLPDLAHHFTLAAAVGGREQAVRYNVRAAEAASASLAFEDAAARLGAALALGVDDDEERARLELERGIAHQRAGQTPEALAAFTAAAEIARARGDPELLARAALGYEDAANQPMATDETAIALLREALEGVAAGDSALRARVLSALSRALVFVGEEEEARALRADAAAMARRLGDPATLAKILIQEEIRNVHVPREDELERLTEARDLALELRDADVLLEAMWRRVATLAGLGELHEARRECGNLRRVAEEARQPVKLNAAALFGSALALCDGKLDEAEQLAEEAEEWTRLMRLPTSGEYGVQLFGIRREQGRLEELRPIVELLARSPDGAHTWRPGLVALLVELGMEDEARAELERLRADRFREVTTALGTAALVYLSDACSALWDADSAALLYPQLEPLAARTVLIGQLVACYGAADRYLGMLAAVLSDWDTAEAHFEYGLYLNRKTAAHTWTAHTAYQYARMLLHRGRAIDRTRAGELLTEAAELSARFGLAALQSRVDDLRASGPRPAEPPDGLSAREVDVLRLVAQGHSNREIGKRLFISEHTAANHIRSILRKTGCANRTDAASYAHQHGLVGES
jgi:class 3 adenylate cyclase/DNA-binding CsgD family transcriptional regulator/tetratricopeptide (TPR) repeat protein